MDLTRNPFVASACEDIIENRTRRVGAHTLLPDTPDAATIRDTFEVTDTFWFLWENLPSGLHSISTIVAVMRGVQIEPRHPAYRVSPTGFHEVAQSQVGDDITLVYKHTNNTFLWLAVLHTH